MLSAAFFSRRSLTLVLYLLLACYVGWMLSLPAWPSQDGPVHLYYTHVISALFSASPSVYRPYLFIKHLLPPYAVYYYTLLVLSKLVSLATADRLVLCGYFISFVLGFRYVARAIGQSADRTSVLACLLLLNWNVGMGFANYCLSLSFALWAIGLWLRLGPGLALAKRTAFVALLVLVTLSHPVPLLIVLGFGGLDLLCRYFIGSPEQGSERGRKTLMRGLLTLAVGALCLVYVEAFTVAHPLAQRTRAHGSALHQVLLRAGQMVAGKSLVLMYGHSWQVELYRACMMLLVVVPALLGYVQFRRNRARGVWTTGDTCLLFFVLLFLGLPLLPSDLSGAYFFTQRLTILLWIMALLAASGWDPKPATEAASQRMEGNGAANVNAMFASAAVLLTLLLLHIADATLRPIAARQRQLAQTEVPLAGQLVVVLEGGAPPDFERMGPAWDPFYWDTVALLRRNDGVLDNAPWLDSPIIPLAPTAALTDAWLPRLLANSPSELTSALNRNPELSRSVLSRAGAVVFSPVYVSGVLAAPAFLGQEWTCSDPAGEQFRLCTRAQPQSEARPQ